MRPARAHQTLLTVSLKLHSRNPYYLYMQKHKILYDFFLSSVTVVKSGNYTILHTGSLGVQEDGSSENER